MGYGFSHSSYFQYDLYKIPVPVYRYNSILQALIGRPYVCRETKEYG